MKTLNVELGSRSYPIFIGDGLLSKTGLIDPFVSGKKVLIVTNDTVAPLYLELTKTCLNKFKCSEIVLPDGEIYKNLATLNLIFDALISQRFDRNSTIVALGGGVIGDLTGFAAACYQRGVDFIQIPTTLLAQVDSSVGGKTGVNHEHGKNMIGAFHQPRCVVADTNTLNTLEDRQLSAGLAEIIKYGLIRDKNFFCWLDDNMKALLARDTTALTYAIEYSCKIKAQIVSEDEKEANIRAILNFGHTFGHAIETGTGYDEWLHGEAIAIGMLLASDMSMRLGWLTPSDVHSIENLIDKALLPTRAPASLETDRFIDLMQIDKKVFDGKLRLILLQKLGTALITDKFEHSLLRKTIDDHHAIPPRKEIGL